MPVDDRKMTGRAERRTHGTRQARPIRNTVKGIRQEYEVGGSGNQFRKLVGIAGYKVAIRHGAFGEAMTRHLQQVPVDVDRNHVTRDLGDLQGKPAVAGAEIDDLHARLDPHRGKHTGGVGPKRLPPSGGRHLGASEESGNIAGHDSGRPGCRVPAEDDDQRNRALEIDCYPALRDSAPSGNCCRDRK